jgi:hypothetical protein
VLRRLEGLMVIGAASATATAPRAKTGIEGTWINGSASTTSYQNLATGEFAPPSGTGMLFEFKSDGSCSHSAMLQSTVYSCTSWVLTSTDDCSWTVEGSSLTVELGPGVLRSRLSGGEVKEGDSKARTQHYQVTLDPGLTLTDDGATFRFQRSE